MGFIIVVFGFLIFLLLDAGNKGQKVNQSNRNREEARKRGDLCYWSQKTQHKCMTDTGMACHEFVETDVNGRYYYYYIAGGKFAGAKYFGNDIKGPIKYKDSTINFLRKNGYINSINDLNR